MEKKHFRYYTPIKFRDMKSKLFAIYLWSFASGVPLLLLTSTLSARLIQSNVPKVKIGLFSLVLIPYVLKVFFAPMVENLSIPFLTHYLGHARAWMATAMSGIMISIFYVASINQFNVNGLDLLFIAALAGAIFSAINDIAEAELRISLLSRDELTLGSACYILGYGSGELCASSITLILASHYGWHVAYIVTGSLILIGVLTVCLGLSKFQPILSTNNKPACPQLSIGSIKNSIKSLYNFCVLTPMQSFFSFSGWYWVFGIVLFYYAASYLSLMMMNPFYLQIGFSISQIGMLRAVCGVFILIFASSIGGILCNRYGILRMLYICGLLYIVSLMMQAFLAQLILKHVINANSNSAYFIFVFTNIVTNLIDVVSVVSYIALIASVCRSPFIATQNALLTSIMCISKIVFSSLGGYLAVYFTWTYFFILSALLIAPAFVCIRQLNKLNPKLDVTNISTAQNQQLINSELLI